MNSNQAVIFIASRSDDLVDPKHAEKLYDAFAGKKKALIMVDGGHNCRRTK